MNSHSDLKVADYCKYSQLFFEKLAALAFILLMQTPVQAQNVAPDPPLGYMAGRPAEPVDSPEPGLLFYLSGEQGTTADFAAGGQRLPNYLHNVNTISEGAHGQALQAEDDQLLSYWAPGNIYSQRGTLSFFWRSRYPVGPTAFPVFRVGYADHSSWDMVWMRIDYNGSGFDAFVTDIGLTRTRVSHYMDEFPGPDKWTHIALSWDETEGIRFYINGTLVEKSSVTGMVFDSGLDQFGPHSRIISPYQVQSAYNFMRGGDIDELRIYDRMLSDDNVAQLAGGEQPAAIPQLNRDLNERRWKDAWWTRYGWNLPNLAPPVLTSEWTSIRKVEIHDAIDIKRWYWKANDGIRETTWPAAYNMSRLPGRYDYFVLPDWDSYSMSGQTIRFHIPEQASWNHIEMWGKAWGQLTHESNHSYDHTFGVRHQHQAKSFHRLDEAKEGGVIRFDNALIEEPIGSFMVYNVEEGRVPEGGMQRTFIIDPVAEAFNPDLSLERIVSFIKGRYPADEQVLMHGVTLNEGTETRSETSDPDRSTVSHKPPSMPLFHVLIPYEEISDAGLDGIVLELPGLEVKPTHGNVFPMNVRVKDPLWEMRDLMDFSFSVEPGRPATLWLDSRDRMIPHGRGLYITISGAGADLTADKLKGMKVRLVYKSADQVLAEHVPDRFTQIRDLHAHNVEENPQSPRLNSYNRFYADVHDLLKYDPGHWLARTYWYWSTRDTADRPEYDIPPASEGVPEWAHLQLEYLRLIKHIAMFYIDERQISNGEFGGGLSDDGDFTNFFPGTALLGIEPDKILKSLLLHMSTYYDQDRDPYDAPLKQRSLPLFTNGLATIKTDELHAYEEGIQVVAQLQLLDYGTPLHINRAMETARQLSDNLTQINPDGHRLFRSRNYGGTNMAEEDPWQWSVMRSYIMLHSAYMVALHNGNPSLRQMIIEIAEALLAYRDGEGNFYTEIHFQTGETRGPAGLAGSTWFVFLSAYELTGDEKYLEPISDNLTANAGFNPDRMVERYTEEVKELGVRQYINTHGSLWIDRVTTRSHKILQEDRLGGVAMTRIQDLYPQHKVSWKFHEPGEYESVAIVVPRADLKNIEIVAFNVDQKNVQADMTVWDITPGRWRVRQGLDTSDDQQMDNEISEKIVHLKRGEVLSLNFASRKQSLISLELMEPAETGYHDRPDHGIGRDDVTINGSDIIVRVHNLGAVDTPASTLELRDALGIAVASVPVPSIEAPLDLIPRWTEVRITISDEVDLKQGCVIVDPAGEISQITRVNNEVCW